MKADRPHQVYSLLLLAEVDVINTIMFRHEGVLDEETDLMYNIFVFTFATMRHTWHSVEQHHLSIQATLGDPQVVCDGGYLVLF